jgi:hypothetical protein
MQKKEFNKPELTKCEQPLDKVTLVVGGYGQNDCPKMDKPFTSTQQ